MTRKYIHKKNYIEPKVVFVFDETPTDETYENFVAKYIALLYRWNERQGNPAYFRENISK